MNTNNSFLQAIKILIKESINGAPYNRTKQAMIVSNNGDNTYDIRFDGKLYTNIISYPNTRSLPLKHIVKVIIPNNQASQMYISAEGSPLIYYPVGSYYETSDSTFNPNNVWGGTWVKDSAGRVTVAIDTSNTALDTIGKTGGNTNAIIPYHNHGFTNPTIASSGAHTHTLNLRNAGTTGTRATNNVTYGASGHDYQNANPVVSSGSHSHTYSANGSVGYAGTSGNTTNANLQPYVVVNRWHRTA